MLPLSRIVAAVVVLASFLVDGSLAGFATSAEPQLATRLGAGWRSIGPSLITQAGDPSAGLGVYNAVGRLAAIAIHPRNPRIMYVGSPGQLGHEGCGVWRTANGGKSWQPMGDNLPTLSIAAIAVDPGPERTFNPTERVYVVTTDRGVFRTDDAGKNWELLSTQPRVRRDTDIGDPTVLLIDPLHRDTLYLTTIDGVLHSIDGGNHWHATLGTGEATSLVMDPQQPGTMYAAIRGVGVYKTATGGAPWTLQVMDAEGYNPKYGVLLALSHAKGQPSETVYALVGNFNGNHQLFRTDSGGTSWTNTFTCGAWDVDCWVLILAVDPADPDRVYMGSRMLYLSEDGGVTFARMPALGKEDRQPDAPHGDYHGFAVHPLDPRIVFAATDGGLYKSTNWAKSGSWSFISPGITNAEMYDLAISSASNIRVLSGTQDNGTVQRDGSPEWLKVHPVIGPVLGYCQGCGGDGGMVAIDPIDADTRYVMGMDAPTLERWSGSTWESFAAGLPSATVAPCHPWNGTFDLRLHPSKPLMLAACSGVYRTPTGGAAQWRRIFQPMGRAHPIQVVRIAVDDANDMYFAGTGEGDGQIFAGLGGENWTEIFNHPDGVAVSGIAVPPGATRMLYASFAPGYSTTRDCSTATSRVFRLTFAGSGRTGDPLEWVADDVTANLPVGLCVNSIVSDGRWLYAGTSKGTFRGGLVMRGTFDGWSWEDLNQGMPPADVRDLELHPTTGNLYAATFGRGAFIRVLHARAR